LEYVKGLTSREQVARLLGTGNFQATLVELVWNELCTLQSVGAAKSKDMESKFAGAVALSYSGLDTFFGGLEGEEIAQVLNIGRATVTREAGSPLWSPGSRDTVRARYHHPTDSGWDGKEGDWGVDGAKQVAGAWPEGADVIAITLPRAPRHRRHRACRAGPRAARRAVRWY
jgi:hypothetical protein